MCFSMRDYEAILSLFKEELFYALANKEATKFELIVNDKLRLTIEPCLIRSENHY